MIKVEVLFPEAANLYGDLFNIRYLKQCLGDGMEEIDTALTEVPAFTKEKVDMIYMGTMPESVQLLAIEALKPYKEKLQELIEAGTVILLTGNAMEVFGQSITLEDGIHEALGITNLSSKVDMMHRFNTLFAGEMETEEGKIRVNAYKSIFAFSYGDNSQNYFLKSIKGCGINKESDLEGFRIHNCFGTALIGPILVINPDLTVYLMKLMGIAEPKLALEEEVRKAYENRKKEFDKETTVHLQ